MQIADVEISGAWASSFLSFHLMLNHIQQLAVSPKFIRQLAALGRNFSLDIFTLTVICDRCLSLSSSFVLICFSRLRAKMYCITI